MPLYRKAAFDYCGWLTKNSRSNFGLGLRLLPKHEREAMEAVYAFCRVVDDVVDREGEPSGAQKELDRWRKELTACQSGFPAHPIAVALQVVVERYQIPIRYFEDLIVGMEMDLRKRRYATFEELKVYCEHVASVVGLISVRVFGCEHPAAEAYANHLGVALQLTNILRDVKSDARRGRVYLPLEELRQFGVSQEDLVQGRLSDSLRGLMGFQCSRARDFFRDARLALRESQEARKLLPARIMGGVYARLLSRIEALQYDVFSHRIRVPRHEQLWVAVTQLL